MFRDDCQPWLTKQGLQLTSYIKGDKMTNPRGQARNDAQRKWRANHPAASRSKTPEQIAKANARERAKSARITKEYIAEAKRLLAQSIYTHTA